MEGISTIVTLLLLVIVVLLVTVLVGLVDIRNKKEKATSIVNHKSRDEDSGR